jgi:hypothetical protein
MYFFNFLPKYKQFFKFGVSVNYMMKFEHVAELRSSSNKHSRSVHDKSEAEELADFCYIRLPSTD